MEKLDVIIVGAGLSGLSCAYTLADSGLQVLVLERGDQPGSKNMTGGRLYLKPVLPYAREMLEGAPFERRVTKERWTFMAQKGSLEIDFTSWDKDFEDHSYTVLRAKLDKFISDKVSEKGIFVVPRYKVDDLLISGGKVEGVVVGSERLYSNVVVIAEGVLGLLSRKLGVKKEVRPEAYALGVKEIIGLPKETINERFNLEDSEGVSHLFIGDVTEGLFGGGFLYTNEDSLSLGVVLRIDALMKGYPEIKPHEIIERFKQRPEIRTLIRDGTLLEYSAHIIPECGFKGIRKCCGNGFLIVGDACGFALNMGVTVRGMDFAIASGVLAAETIIEASKTGDFSERSLSLYEQKLRESFVIKDLERFKDMPDVLEFEDLFSSYPGKLVELLRRITYFGEEPKEGLFKTFKNWAKDFFSLKTLKWIMKLRKI